MAVISEKHASNSNKAPNEPNLSPEIESPAEDSFFVGTATDSSFAGTGNVDSSGSSGGTDSALNRSIMRSDIWQMRTNPREARPATILRMQRTIGNQAVQRLLAVQPPAQMVQRSALDVPAYDFTMTKPGPNGNNQQPRVVQRSLVQRGVAPESNSPQIANQQWQKTNRPPRGPQPIVNAGVVGSFNDFFNSLGRYVEWALATNGDAVEMDYALRIPFPKKPDLMLGVQFVGKAGLENVPVTGKPVKPYEQQKLNQLMNLPRTHGTKIDPRWFTSRENSSLKIEARLLVSAKFPKIAGIDISGGIGGVVEASAKNSGVGLLQNVSFAIYRTKADGRGTEAPWPPFLLDWLWGGGSDAWAARVAAKMALANESAFFGHVINVKGKKGDTSGELTAKVGTGYNRAHLLSTGQVTSKGLQGRPINYQRLGASVPVVGGLVGQGLDQLNKRTGGQFLQQRDDLGTYTGSGEGAIKQKIGKHTIGGKLKFDHLSGKLSMELAGEFADGTKGWKQFQTGVKAFLVGYNTAKIAQGLRLDPARQRAIDNGFKAAGGIIGGLPAPNIGKLGNTFVVTFYIDFTNRTLYVGFQQVAAIKVETGVFDMNNTRKQGVFTTPALTW